jgi:Raf kinase inhibitor-like YbhB/YbcL family protein
MALELVVAGFSQNSAIPRSHTCEGADLSPAIEWNDAPETTQSFALIVDDPDAPGRTWNHWLLYDISPSVHSLDPGFKPNTVHLSKHASTCGVRTRACRVETFLDAWGLVH